MITLQLDEDQVFYIKQNIIGIMHNNGIDEARKNSIIRLLLKLDDKDTKYSAQQIHQIIQGKNKFDSCLHLAISEKFSSVFDTLLFAGDSWQGLVEYSYDEYNAVLALIGAEPCFAEAYATGDKFLQSISVSEPPLLKRDRSRSLDSFFTYSLSTSQDSDASMPGLAPASNASSTNVTPNSRSVVKLTKQSTDTLKLFEMSCKRMRQEMDLTAESGVEVQASDSGLSLKNKGS